MERLDGKVCVVTGGTSGIGGAISRGLAGKGATVVITGRDPAKGSAAVAELWRESGNRSVEFLQADMFSQEAIRSLAASVQERYPRIELLVNNVGGSFWRRGVTGAGIEKTLALNLLAPFLLTELILPTLKRSAPARIVNIATRLRAGARVQFDDLHSERKYSPFAAYVSAKVGVMLFTYELARRLEGTGVTANCVHPGIVPDTEFGSDMPVWKSVGPLLTTLLRVRVGLGEAADTAVYLASSDEVAGVTGKYFIKRRPVSSPRQTYDQEAALRLWSACEALTRSQGDAAAEDVSGG